MRRIIALWALVALICTPLYVFVPAAHAQQMCGIGSGNACDEGQAFSECTVAGQASVALLPSLRRNPVCKPPTGTTGVVFFQCVFDMRDSVGAPWKPAFATCGQFYYSADKKCAARPEQTGWKGGDTAGTVAVCSQGCAYTSSLDPASPSGFTYWPSGSTCTNNDHPEPEPYTPDDGGGDDGGGTGGETGGGDGGGGDGGGDGGEGGDNGGGGDGGSGGDGDGDGDSDGGDDGDGDGDGDGENPSLPENPTYEGDIPMPYADPPIPSSYLGQWDSGLGGGSCPAAKTVNVGFGPVSTSVSFEFKPLCDFAQLIKGLVIACAAVVAGYIVSGVRK